jgi:type I restriction enzyme, S subunit
MSWREITLGSAIHVKHGYAFKGELFSDSGDYIVLTPGNFNEGGGFRSRPEKDRAYMGDIPESFVLDEGDLIVAMTEQGPGLLGSSALIPEAARYLHNQRLGLVDQIDSTLLEKRFLYFLFNTRSVRGQISGSASGTKVRHTAPERIYRVCVRVPDVRTQGKIAEILFAYDDLIENNRRRMQLLEEAARQLYREWFVRLRFPGREHTPIVNGVPEGWEEGQVGALAELQSGYAFKSKDWVQEGNLVIKIANIDRNMVDTTQCECVSDEVAEQARNFLLKQGDLLIAMTGATVGKIGIMPRTKKNCYLNQRVGIFRIQSEINPVPFLFTFFNTENAKQQVVNFAAGAAQPNISPTQIESIKLLIPSKTLFTAFADTCEPLFSQRLVLIEQNEYLKAARHLLLPRLMSGEIAV